MTPPARGGFFVPRDAPHTRERAPPMELLHGFVIVAVGSCMFGLIVGYCAAAMNHTHHHRKGHR